MFSLGSIVLCTAGHDKGRFYTVVKWQGDRVLIADGKARKLETPKAKNPAHLQKTNHILNLSLIDTNKKLRLALAPFNQGEQTAAETEGGERLVQD